MEPRPDEKLTDEVEDGVYGWKRIYMPIHPNLGIKESCEEGCRVCMLSVVHEALEDGVRGGKEVEITHLHTYLSINVLGELIITDFRPL